VAAKGENVSRALALGILLLAFALRAARLGYQELRGDEAFGYFFALRSYSDIVRATLELREPHPVASYFVQHAWLGWAGHSEFALRFLGVCWGVLAVALLLRLARTLEFAPAALLTAGLLLAVSPYAVWHAQDARMYSMSLALTVAAVWLALEALQRRRWPWIAAYVAVAWLALHTHYFAAFVLAALTVFVVGRAVVVAPARMALPSWALWNVVVLALYAPWLADAADTLRGYGGNGDSPGLVDALARSLRVLAVGESNPAGWVWAWAALAATLLLVGSVALWRTGARGRRTLWLLACTLFVPLLLTWWGARNRPIFNERYLVAAAPAFFLWAAAGLLERSQTSRHPRRAAGVETPAWSSKSRLKPAGGRDAHEFADDPAYLSARRREGNALRAVAALLLALLLAGMAFSLANHYANAAYSKTRGWRELAATVLRLGASVPAEQVRYAQNYPDPTLWYYTGDVPHLVLPPAAGDWAGAQREAQALADAGVRRVVLAEQPSPTWDVDGIAHATLEEHFDRVAQPGVGGFSAAVYSRPGEDGAARDDVFDGWLRLTSAELQPADLIPGGLLAVHLDWLVEPPRPNVVEKVTVQLLGPAGALVAQSDQPLAPSVPPGQSVPHAYGILLPDELPPGEYRLIAAVYDPAQEGAPRLSVAGGDSVELARWEVQ
jgi:hypothetical protein